MPAKDAQRYFFYGFFLVTIILALLIFRPFVTVLILGTALAVVFYPLFNFFLRHFSFGKRWIAALCTVIVFVMILLGPLLLFGTIIFYELQNVPTSLSSGGAFSTLIQHVSDSVNAVLPGSFSFNIANEITQAIGNFMGHITGFFAGAIGVIFSLLLVVLALFYFLKDGTSWRQEIIHLSPLADEDDEKILKKLEDAINGVVKGYLLIALVQGFLIGLGLAIFGISNAALWGVVGGVASLVPSIGTALVTGPIVVYLFAIGDTTAAVGFLVWAVLLVSMIDNVLNPIVVGKKVALPPLLILFSVLGGISLFGPVGLLAGPLVMSLLYALVSIYRTRT